MDVEEGERKRGKKSIEREVEINVNDKKKKTAEEERKEKMMKYYRKRKVTEGWELQ